MICLMVRGRHAKVTAIPQMKPGSPVAEQRLSCMGQNPHKDGYIHRDAAVSPGLPEALAS